MGHVGIENRKREKKHYLDVRGWGEVFGKER